MDEFTLQTTREAVAAEMPLTATTIRSAKVPSGRGGRLTSEQVLDEAVRARLTPLMSGVGNQADGVDKTRIHFLCSLEFISAPLVPGDTVQIGSVVYTVDKCRPMGNVPVKRRYEVSVLIADYIASDAAVPDEGE